MKQNPSSYATTSFWPLLRCPFPDHPHQPPPLPLCLSPASFSPGVRGQLMMASTPLFNGFLSRKEDPEEQGLGFARCCVARVPRV